MSASAQGASAKPEYQHFVPQFMLRNFAHKYSGSKESSKDDGNGKDDGKSKKKGKGKGKGKDKDKAYRGELVVNNVNLRAEPFAIVETKVARIFGNYDMYQDKTQPTAEQRQIETMLSQLESQASTVFRKFTKAFDAGNPNLWVTRDELSCVRKFLFILKYRGTTFYRRYHHDNFEGYQENDKSKMQAYMKENNFKRPLDVWFQGLKAIITVKTDNSIWKRELPDKMYPDDAMWFIMYWDMMYMAICTPSEPQSEFILTDNSYSIFEGPNTFDFNPETGRMEDSGWLNYHEFAPLTPKLMIVLRSLILPVPEEDGDPKIREMREQWREVAVEKPFGGNRESMLADLPIGKARNNYSEVVNGQVQLLRRAGSIGQKGDKFCFTFFPVGKEHVNKINHILLDNAFLCSSIVFDSREVFLETLEWYLTVPCTVGKQITGNFTDERRRLLVNLAALIKSLGSTKEPVWVDEEAIRSDMAVLDFLFHRMVSMYDKLDNKH